MKPILILCTINTKENANALASRLVEKKLAACVSIIPKITSVYKWKGKVCKEAEFLLIIKSLKSKFLKLKKEIETHHPYDVPEIISLKISEGNKKYLDWIVASLKNYIQIHIQFAV